MSTFILAIDQGTTSSRALVFDAKFQVVGAGQHEFTQHFPHSGWVEHDAEEIWDTTLRSCEEAIATAGITADQLVGIGITNQRETTVLWDRTTGKPLAPAIVWQDRRTAGFCDELRAAGHETQVQDATGLLIDSYFSASKLRWEIRANLQRAQAPGLVESSLGPSNEQPASTASGKPGHHGLASCENQARCELSTLASALERLEQPHSIT